MQRSIKIVHPGMFTTVQDAGRSGYLRYGLPPSGAMDRPVFEAANALVGNPSGAAVLECTGTMPVIEVSHAAKIGVGYAGCVQFLEAAPGERVEFEPMKTGYRAYVAFEGGLDVPEVMGSRSTYIPGRLGGFEGRVLREGDCLPVGDSGSRSPREAEDLALGSRSGNVVRVIPGPEAGWFDCGGLNTFLTELFQVSGQSDRTGIRLEGAALSFRSDQQMVSAGLAFGTIQVPPSGMPIIMMADHPTTGGYPRIGHVVEADLPLLAQLRPNDTIHFVEAV